MSLFFLWIENIRAWSFSWMNNTKNVQIPVQILGADGARLTSWGFFTRSNCKRQGWECFFEIIVQPETKSFLKANFYASHYFFQNVTVFNFPLISSKSHSLHERVYRDSHPLFWADPTGTSEHWAGKIQLLWKNDSSPFSSYSLVDNSDA